MGFADLLKAADTTSLKLLGEDWVYTPAVGSPATVRGHFLEPYTRVDAGEGGVVGSLPEVFFRTEDLPSDPEAAPPTSLTRVVNGRQYRVSEPKKDGQGGVRLALHNL